MSPVWGLLSSLQHNDWFLSSALSLVQFLGKDRACHLPSSGWLCWHATMVCVWSLRTPVL
ncbi:hypothetical protein I79_026236 [Cricetulus griseus]|uniref:Uncharacterized protein n=1 Tax=Cricetulus griseus TaxID=10029 RepID=G3IQC3_CRIGR|nr:hypothetical protein I79_026236 [Cricetulus griseus]